MMENKRTVAFEEANEEGVALRAVTADSPVEVVAHNERSPLNLPVPRRSAPGKLPRPKREKRVAPPPPPSFAEMTNSEFVLFPKDESETAPAKVIVIRQGEDGEVFYRLWGFGPGEELKALLAATAHLGGQTADSLSDVVRRLNAVVGAAVGQGTQ